MKGPAEKICKDYDYTAVHLHPASFFIVDELMEIEELDETRAAELIMTARAPWFAE